MPKTAILGLSGPALTPEEKDFFQDADPLGFILFARNCETPEQVTGLVADLRRSVGRDDAPILIDQEGGRVARLTPPHWRAAPPAKVFGDLWLQNPADARIAVRLNARLIGAELRSLGINVDCAPVLDIPVPGADDIIGDRAFGTEADCVAALGAAFCLGLMDAGVLPVIKHIPGHGRAAVDSHKALPRVDTGRALLQESDFLPFAALARATRDGDGPNPWAMTAHVVYSDIDPDHPATLSRAVITDVIRGAIAFDGIVISDDLSMEALSGPLGSRARAARAAGCDLVLHCNGDMAEMKAIMAEMADISGATGDRLTQSLGALCAPEKAFDGPETELALTRIMGQNA